MPTPHLKKLISFALGLMVLGSLWFYFAPVGLGGSTTYVVTNGVSMEPRFHTGDLAIVRGQSSYHVGEIVAYHNKMLGTVVLHRIVGREGDRYLFKGDNNNFVDFEHPLANQLIGSLWLHIAGGGARLKSIRSPALVGILVAIGILMFCGAAFTRRRRRRRRQTQLGESAGRSPERLPKRSMEPLIGVLGIGLIALLPFVVLALLAFTRPLTALRPFKIPYKQSGHFSYTANATPGPAYPGDRAVTGEPLFTQVLKKVDVHFAYLFNTAAKHSLTGKASLDATISSSSGWHATVPLGAPTYFRGDHATVAASLDLPSLVTLMHSVQTTTRVNGTYTLTITPHVHTSGSLELIPLRTSFSPKIDFVLSEFEAQPSDATGGSPTTGNSSAKTSAASQFSPSSSGSATGKRNEPLYLTFKFTRTTVATARAIALGGIALVLFAVLAVLALVRPKLRDETALIRARYGRLIVPVAHVWPQPGTPVVDVADIDALVRLAEHYERSILFEVIADGDAFWVTDESGQFRYTVGASKPTDADAAAAAAAAAGWAHEDAPDAPAGRDPRDAQSQVWPVDVAADAPTLTHEIVADAPVWAPSAETLEPSTSELLVKEVYADELELGGVFAPSATPAPQTPAAEPAAHSRPAAERWAVPADANAFVQEGVDRRRTDEDLDVDVSLWRRTDLDGDVSLWRGAEDGDISLWRRTEDHEDVEDGDVSLWRGTGEPVDASAAPVAAPGEYFAGLEWTTNS